MSDVAEIVPAGRLQEMLEAALLETGLHHDFVVVEKENAFWDERPGKHLAHGNAVAVWDTASHDNQMFDWEIIGGTSEDDILVFDELEVLIDFEEGDDV